MRRALGDVPVGDVMTRDPETVSVDLTVEELLDEHLMQKRWSSYPIVRNDGSAAGLVTLARVKGVPPEERGRTAVGDIACSIVDVPLTSADEPLIDLLPRMAGCTDGRALVVEDDQVVGILSPSDVMRHLERSELAAGGGGRPRVAGI